MKSSWIRRSIFPFAAGVCLTWLCVARPSTVAGQPEGAKQDPAARKAQVPGQPAIGDKQPPVAAGEIPPSKLVQISDEPKTIDPATLLPPALAARVTVNFTEQPLREIVKWLQQERSLNVLVDYSTLAEEGLLVGEPITDHSEDAPLYLLLNRLQVMRLGWYYEDETLFITTTEQADEYKLTVPYNLADLFDSGFKAESGIRTVVNSTGGKWEDVDGEGGASVLLGDVLFVRQSNAVHQQVAGLLAALRKHGRRTFTADPAQHEILRQKLDEKITVEFDDAPLNTVIQELARQVKADLRLDLIRLADEGIPDRSPVSVKMTDRPLAIVLRAFLHKLNLTWTLRDGVLWITTVGCEEANKTAVFDVRDLCRNPRESGQLMRAIQTQTIGKWEDEDGEGGVMTTPKTGVLVVRQSERALDDLLKLLESYRAALRISKPREIAVVDPEELVTRYYRLQREIAVDLEKLLPTLIQPKTWNSPRHPEAAGSIHQVSSSSSLLNANGVNAQPAGQPRPDVLMVPNSVLIIHQSREVHDAIDRIIQKIQYGDAGDVLMHQGGPLKGEGGQGGPGLPGGMGGGGGGQQGGFGGGFFSVPTK
jgi:hypothetical protein